MSIQRERPQTNSERSRRWRLANPERNKELKRRWRESRRVLGPRPRLSPEELLRRERSRQPEKDRRREAVWRSSDKGRMHILVRRARIRANHKGVPFAIKTDDLELPTVCPVLGIPLSFAAETPLANRPSLDRIIPALGYVRGNVRIISFRANSLKNNGTSAELSAVAADVEAHELSA